MLRYTVNFKNVCRPVRLCVCACVSECVSVCVCATELSGLFFFFYWNLPLCLKEIELWHTDLSKISEYTTCSMQNETKKNQTHSWISYQKTHTCLSAFYVSFVQSSRSCLFVPLPHLMVQLSVTVYQATFNCLCLFLSHWHDPVWCISFKGFKS